MFGLFIANEFKGFWQNQSGDRFIHATCSALDYDINQAELYQYNIKNPPLNYAFDSEKNIVIYKEIIGEDEVVTVEVDKTVNGELFFSNGQEIRPC